MNQTEAEWGQFWEISRNRPHSVGWGKKIKRVMSKTGIVAQRSASSCA